ncbi:MAG: DUF4198 domain-containing protein [Burkholderiales bacterium]|jgi:uncharacterized GH25 family protein|nr:DUF4198 domain-containing protein [Burkholderiales bacterium]
MKVKTMASRAFRSGASRGAARLTAGAAVFSLALFAVLFASSSAQAHEFLLKPNKFTIKKGEKVAAHAMASHVFMVSEEMEPLNTVEASVRQGKTVTPLKFTENAKAAQLETSFSLASDAPALLLGRRHDDVVCLTTRGAQDGTRKELEAKGLTVKSCTLYEKFVKVWLNAQASDKSFAEPVDQKLEIIPLTPPAQTKVGEEMQFKVLYDGKPLSAAAWATYDGFSKHENTYAYYTEADAQGIVNVKITAPGAWMVRVAHTVKNNGGDIDATETRAVAMFEVR